MSNDNKKIAIAILLVTIVGLVIYSYLNDQQHVEKENTLIQEKETILKNLTKIENQYDTAIAQNTMLSDELEEQRKSITNFKDSLKKIKTTNWKLIKFYKNKIKSLNEVSKKLIHLNDSIVEKNKMLNIENQDLTVQKDSLSVNLEKQTTYNDTLAKQNLNLAKKVAIGEIVKVSRFGVTALRERSGGKYKETDRARRVDLFKTSFMLNENPIAKEKDIQTHVVIKAPNGSLLIEKGVFTTSDGDRIKYSDESVIPYKKAAIIGDIVTNVGGKNVEKGNYIIDFYAEGVKVGTINKILK